MYKCWRRNWTSLKSARLRQPITDDDGDNDDDDNDDDDNDIILFFYSFR